MKKLTGIILLLAILLSVLSVSPVFAKTEKEMLDEGHRFMANKSYGNAIKAYTETIKQFPNSSEAFLFRGLALTTVGEIDYAIMDFTRSLTIKPNSGEAYFSRATCYLLLSQFEKSIEDNKKVVSLEPENYSAYFNMGVAYTKLGQYSEGLKCLDKAISLHPGEFPLYAEKGSNYFSSDMMDKSAECFKQASQINPTDNYMHLMYGLALMRQGKDGAGYFREYLEKNKDKEWPKPVFRMLSESITPAECLKMAVDGEKDKMMQRKCEAYFYIGEYYLIKNDKAKAKEYFEKCVATGVNYFNEYYFSKAELKKL
ncbi:MAG: tetratricopeptide repeat protein [Firmicutes bacterium]|nr:tetratricopeptide repeat protein [Bacillota bacterium]